MRHDTGGYWRRPRIAQAINCLSVDWESLWGPTAESWARCFGVVAAVGKVQSAADQVVDGAIAARSTQ